MPDNKLPMPVVCDCGFSTMDAKAAVNHRCKYTPTITMYCQDCGKGYPFNPPDIELGICECGCYEFADHPPEELGKSQYKEA